MLSNEETFTIELDANEIRAIVNGLILHANYFLQKSLVNDDNPNDVESRLFMLDLIERFPTTDKTFIVVKPNSIEANAFRALLEPSRPDHRTD